MSVIVKSIPRSSFPANGSGRPKPSGLHKRVGGMKAQSAIEVTFETKRDALRARNSVGAAWSGIQTRVRENRLYVKAGKTPPQRRNTRR